MKPSLTSRIFSGTVTVVTVALFSIQMASAPLAGQFGPAGVPTGRCSSQIISLGSAAGIDLRVGDSVDLRSMNPASRAAFILNRAPVTMSNRGEVANVAVVRSGRVVSVPVRAAGPGPILFWAAIAFKLIVLVLGLFILWRGRDRSARILGIWCLGICIEFPWMWFGVLPPSARVVATLVTWVAFNSWPFLLYLFIESLSRDFMPRRVFVATGTLLLVLIALNILDGSVNAASQIVSGCKLVWLGPAAFRQLATAIQAVVLALYVISYVSSHGPQRLRLRWVFWSFLASRLGQLNFVLTLPPLVIAAGWLALIIFPLGCAYAILRYRLVDVNFVISRAAVISAMLAVIVVVLALVQWSLASLLAGIGRFPSLAVSAMVTLALGLSMPTLYWWTAALVERNLFRRQYQARERVRQLAAGLPYAESAEAIAQVLTKGVCGSLDLPSGAVFRRGKERAFTLDAAVGWSGDARLEPMEAERLAMAFQGTRAMLHISDQHLAAEQMPRGDKAPIVAYPLFARQALIGFVLFSIHPASVDLDPDERALLAEVVLQASRGYDAVELAERVQESYEARMEAEARAKEALQRSKADLERLNEAYVRFVPSEFLRYLDKDSIVDVALGDSIQRKMTVLFSDIRSFTTISESMTPPEIFAYLNRYLHRVEPIISEHGGFIDKYIGDAIMGLFPSSADDALKAGIELQREVRVLNRKLTDEQLPTLTIGVGLHTGDLMLGTIGGRNRMETTVIADAVNAASRLEGATKIFGCGILISKETRDALAEPARFMLRYLGTLQVKGKTERLTTYEAFDADAAEIIVRKENSAELFALALAAYESGNLAEAESAFSNVLTANAEDGPAAYYLARCREHQLAPTTELP